MDDINVSTDIALCRKCGKTCSFSMIRTLPNASTLLSKPPPKGVKVEQDMMGNGTTITYRRIPGVVLFLIPFMVAWSGLSMGGLYWTQIRSGTFDLERSLFGIPFLIGTIVIISFILFGLFGKWTVHLNRGQGTVFAGVEKLGWKRKFTYNRNSLITIKTIVGSEGSHEVISVTTDNTDFSFGAIIKDDAKAFIAATLLRESRR